MSLERACGLRKMISQYPNKDNYAKLVDGSGCVPVDAPVFKIGGRLRRASGGGFDSHPLPPTYFPRLFNSLDKFVDGLEHGR